MSDKKKKKKEKKSRKRCAPTSSSEGDTSTSSTSSDDRRRRAAKVPKIEKCDIDILITLRYDEGFDNNKKPYFPPQLLAEFNRGFQIESTFYDQLKVSTQVHVLTSPEFTNLAETHDIRLSAPQFKYQIDKSGLMDEVPYPINDFFRKTCKDPYMTTVKGSKPKATVAISFYCSIIKANDNNRETGNEQWVMTRLKNIAEEYLDTPMHITSHRLSSLLNQFIANEKIQQIKQKSNQNRDKSSDTNSSHYKKKYTSPTKGYYTSSYRGPQNGYEKRSPMKYNNSRR